MNARYLGVALLAVGVVLLVWGFRASDSISSEFSEFFKGHPSRETVWLIAGGVLLAVVGLGIAVRGGGKRA